MFLNFAARGTRPAPLADTRVLPMYKYFSWKWVPQGSSLQPLISSFGQWSAMDEVDEYDCLTLRLYNKTALNTSETKLLTTLSTTFSLLSIKSGCWTRSVFASSSEMKSMPHSRAVPAMCCVELALKWMLCTRLVSKGPLIHCFVRSWVRRATLCHSDEPQRGQNSCPWLPLPGWYGFAHVEVLARLCVDVCVPFAFSLS